MAEKKSGKEEEKVKVPPKENSKDAPKEEPKSNEKEQSPKPVSKKQEKQTKLAEDPKESLKKESSKEEQEESEPDENSPEKIIEEINKNHIQYPEGVPYEPEPMINPKVRNPNSISVGGVIFAILVAAVLIYAVFMFIENRDLFNKEPVKVVYENLSTTYVPVYYNFEDYKLNSYYYDGMNISVKGFLKHELRLIGRTAQANDYYVVDDYGNELILSFSQLKNPDYFTPLFKEEGTTTELFNITGTFRREGEYILKIYPVSINPAKRDQILE